MSAHPTRRQFLGQAAALAAGPLIGSRASAAAAGTSPAPAAAPSDRPGKPNVLYVFSDQQRRHALGFMGQDPVHTPRTDAFAKQAVVCRHALATSPLCTPFRGSLITGMHPVSTGVLTNNNLLDPKLPSVGRAFKDGGYRTGWIGKWHLHGGWQNRPDGFVPPENRMGFDHWFACECNHDIFWQEYYTGGDPKPVVDRFGWQLDLETEKTIEFLRAQDGAQPFALFVSTVPPHNGTHGGRSRMPHRPTPPGERPMLGPFEEDLVYHAPDQFEWFYRFQNLDRRPNVRGNYARHHCDGYFGGVTAMDHAFGRILDELDRLGLADNTIVVYSSDHGEMMGSHDLMSKNRPFEESVGIPFLVRWPGHIAPGWNNSLLTQIDIAPTLLGLCGVGAPSAMEGLDLSAELRGAPATRRGDALMTQFTFPDEVAAGTDRFANGWRAIRTPTHIFYDANSYFTVPHGPRALYDLEKDPFQLNPIREGDSAAADRLIKHHAALLKKRLRETRDPWAEKIVL